MATDRVVIVGAGLAGLYAALHLAPRPVLVLTPDPLGTGASSAWAQGGVAAAMDRSDSPAAHAADTVAAGAGIVDAQVAASVTGEAPDHIAQLTDFGTPFDRDDAGRYVLSREAAHSIARVVRVKGDQAGREIMETLIEEVRDCPSVQVMDGVLVCGLATGDGGVTGVDLLPAAGGGEPVRLTAPAVLLAGGGSGGLYALTTNPSRIRGQVIGAAARAGAVIADPEFVQFHPTAMDVGLDPAPLATEALRGEGAVLIDRNGHRFMPEVHPDAELAPRDVVARAIFAQTQAGMRPCLDTRSAVGAEIGTRFPYVAAACAAAGIDPVTEAIPVAAAAHYHMGGVAVDASGRAGLDRLWVCGEASSTGLHGANRLASNGLLEALVYGRACAADIAASLGAAPAANNVPPVPKPDFPPAPAIDTTAATMRLRQAMTDHVGVVRDAAGLREALRLLADLDAAPEGRDPVFATMIATATLITAAALQRRESRGGHYRSDFPTPDPAQAARTRLRLADAIAIRDAARGD
ncbi:L-aspartate oxidase [Rhodobacteraceae bacterium KN286]|uniref:L-aspartate oxidase n=1 Tax=Oceanomicrobium pacificus TaxID=2692916 RepID=A0A6B0TS93_9RHOB|nr:L-aspartate oxidase [Oceanomicrobium pacificus]